MSSGPLPILLLCLLVLTPEALLEYRLKFNNASQRLFGNLVYPTILVWKTNEAANPRYAAEARRECLENRVRCSQ
jgi:hypothetical protein